MSACDAITVANVASTTSGISQVPAECAGVIGEERPSQGQLQHLDRRRVARVDLDRKRLIPAENEIDAEEAPQTERLDERPADRLDAPVGRFRQRTGAEAAAIPERRTGVAHVLPRHAERSRAPRNSQEEGREAAALDPPLEIDRLVRQAVQTESRVRCADRVRV